MFTSKWVLLGRDVLTLPLFLTETSKSKFVREVGLFLLLTWLLTVGLIIAPLVFLAMIIEIIVEI